ncbi:MAG: DUF4160 domain-containing protein [Prevotellaceae bacterium]|jgi:hypothetical protein|nr:DUF4160 domain-containing protein [Prevotellaceae bacterium]
MPQISSFYGKMPGRALRLAFEWLDLHREELLEEWNKAQRGEALQAIAPLK